MALEDFDEAFDELELDVERVDLTSAGGIDPGDPLDEDLFDFPPAGVFESVQERGRAPEGEAPASREEEPSRAEPEPSTPATVAREDAPSDAGTAGSKGHAPDLDEDIFDFASIFAGGDVVAGAIEDSTAPEDAVPEPVTEREPAAAAAPERPDPEPVTVQKEPARRAPAARPTPPPIAPKPRAEKVGGEESPRVDPGAPPPSVPVPTGGVRDKLVMLLAIGFLVVNTALILLAWQANSSFHGTLESVSRGLAEGLSRSGGQEAQAAPKVEYVPVPTTGHPPRTPDEPPSVLGSRAGTTLESARRMIGEGAFLDARKNLYHLLANADLLTLDREVVAEAEFLIAQTYELQGAALLEREDAR